MQYRKSINSSLGNCFAKKWAVCSTLMLTLTTALIASCETSERQVSLPGSTNVSTEKIAENPNRYIGQIVTVRSEPIKKVSPNTFTIKDKQFFGSEPILVVNVSGNPFVFPEDGTDVQITGEARNFVFADIERKYNLGLEANAYADYETQPALIARSIAIAPDPGELTRDPQQYYGKPLAVTGEVEKIQGANAFTLDEDRLFGGQDLLVLRAIPATANQPAIQEGEKVAVKGVLRPFVIADLERDYDFNWSRGIQQQLEAEYRNKPVLVAENVYPSAIPDSAQ